jgi:ectoine hydroxylase-related dioxygenase (phytanoyl-CoA dioxygenase family)
MSNSSDDETLAVLKRDGYAVVPNVLGSSEVAVLRRDLEHAISKEAVYHRGTEYQDYGMVMVCCTHARSFVDVLGDQRVMGVIERILSPGSIVYAFTSSSMPPHSSNYSQRIHVDCPRMIPGYETNAGVMILLDEFTAKNGATWILRGSQQMREAPTPEHFFANAQRVIAPAGSLVYLNPRVWHAGGKNETGTWRHSITVNMCRPYMKQRLDIPKMMAASGIDLTGVSEQAMQKMGFYAQVPESLDEYYLPREQRKFKQETE